MVSNNQPKWSIRSSVAFIICIVFLAGGFVFTGFKPAAQYSIFAGSLVFVLGLYLGKRVWKHKINLQNGFKNE